MELTIYFSCSCTLYPTLLCPQHETFSYSHLPEHTVPMSLYFVPYPSLFHVLPLPLHSPFSGDTPRDPQADAMVPHRGDEWVAHNQRCIIEWTNGLGNNQGTIRTILENILSSSWWMQQSSVEENQFDNLVKNDGSGQCWLCPKSHGSKATALKHVKKMLDFKSQ